MCRVSGTPGGVSCGRRGSGSNSGSACCCGGRWGAWGWGEPWPLPRGPIHPLPLPARGHRLSVGVEGYVSAPPYADQTGDRAAMCQICTLFILEGWGAAARQGPPNSGSRGARRLPCSGRVCEWAASGIFPLTPRLAAGLSSCPSRGGRAGLWGMGAAGLGFRTSAFVRSLLSFLPASIVGFFSLILLSQFLVFFLANTNSAFHS